MGFHNRFPCIRRKPYHGFSGFQPTSAQSHTFVTKLSPNTRMDWEKRKRSKEVTLYATLLVLAALFVPVSYWRYGAIHQPAACAQGRPDCDALLVAAD
jgi:hypothetical protein